MGTPPAIENCLACYSGSRRGQNHPLRHLLWEPEQFEPKPEERRVKAGFPLREVSLLSAVNKPLKHFSLLNLEGIRKVVKEDLSKIGADLEEDLVKVPGNSSEKSTEDTTDNSFHEWLRLQRRHRDQGPGK